MRCRVVRRRGHMCGKPASNLPPATDAAERAAPDHACTERHRIPQIEGVAMKILIAFLVAALVFGGGQALAARSSHQPIRTLKVVMHDPGCHWFLVHGKFAV